MRPESSRYFWRRDPESNWARRICNPLHNRFAIAPFAFFLGKSKTYKVSMVLFVACTADFTADQSPTQNF